MNRFDRKFGEAFMGGLPEVPGIYRVYGANDALIYVGKAKNLRRRLSQYRNAKRRKKHLKMRQIVGDAEKIEITVCRSELEASLLENEWIQKHRPRWNVAGAFSFIYPLIGVRASGGLTELVYTTRPESFPEFSMHGTFRSRQLSREGFKALVELLSYLGHPVPRSKLYGKDRLGAREKYAVVSAFRMLPERWVGLLEEFLRGESRSAMEELVLALTENAGARRRPRMIQEALNSVRRLWRHEIQPLADARKRVGFGLYPVPQAERDRLFLKAKGIRGVSERVAPSELPRPG